MDDLSEPIWISDDVVLAIHRRQLAEHGALNKPKNLYHYSDPKPTIAALAASYAYAISGNHAFVDGNKRTAYIICQLFLALNGYSLTASSVEKYEIFIKLAASRLSESELADWIENHTTRK